MARTSRLFTSRVNAAHHGANDHCTWEPAAQIARNDAPSARNLRDTRRLPPYGPRGIRRLLTDNANVLICTTCCILLGGLLFAVALIDYQRTTDTSAAAPMRSEAGKRLVSFCIDSQMTTDQERVILQRLQQHDDTSWEGFTIADLIHHLNTITPTHCEESELEIYEIFQDTKLAGSIPEGTVLQKLNACLHQLDLAFQIKNNLLRIETLDSAHSRPTLRSFDLSPLESFDTLDSVRHSITMHISPDDWISAGGESTITVQATNSQLLLTVSAPYQTQLEVEAYLEMLIKREKPCLLPVSRDRAWQQPGSWDSTPGVIAGGYGCNSGYYGAYPVDGM